ncbi:MAG: hypothetical protein AAFU77_13730 [Myxococcota bacterium]
MSNFDLQIETDKTEVVGGETISGKVKVRSQKDYNTNAITLSLGWYTHGFGNGDRGQAAQETLYTGRIIAGRPYEFPFQFQLPNGPVTYRGKLVNVDWDLNAQADISWKIDPKAEAELYLTEPGPDGPYEPGNPSDDVLVDRERSLRTGSRWGLVILVPFLLVGAGFLYAGITGFDLFMLLFGVLFLGVPLIGLSVVLRNTVAEKRIGEVTVEMPDQVSPGEVCPIRIAFTPNASGTINGVKVTLTGKERATAGSGTNRRTKSHVLGTVEVEDSAAAHMRLLPGKPVESRLDVQIPQDAALSFYASDNSVKWEIAVRVDIPGWPDWLEKRDVIVVP